MHADVVTITLNPAIDHTVFLERFEVGSVNRTERHHRQAGGKGVNVSSMLADHGVPSIATGFLGRENPRVFEELCARGPVADAFVRVAGETRTSIKIVETGTRTTTDINFPGLVPDAADLDALEETLRGLLLPGRWFVLAGSLPAAVPLDRFASWIRLIKSGGGLLAVDTSGEALRVAIDAGADVIKPNEHELGELLGRPLADLASQIDAARALHEEKVPHVILSLGAEGALFLSPDGALMAAAAPVDVVSTVGAGDSLLAGYLAGLLAGRAPADRARLATVFAWAALEDVRRRLPAAEVVAERMARIGVRPPPDQPR